MELGREKDHGETNTNDQKTIRQQTTDEKNNIDKKIASKAIKLQINSKWKNCLLKTVIKEFVSCESKSKSRNASLLLSKGSNILWESERNNVESRTNDFIYC